MTYKEAIETLTNGNIKDFIAWMRKAKKIDLLRAIRHYQEEAYGPEHEILTCMINILYHRGFMP